MKTHQHNIMMVTLASAIMMAACGADNPGGAEATPESTSSRGVVADLHRRSPDEPVLLILEENGLAATVPSGGWRVTIAEGPFVAAAYDAQQALLWASREGRLEVLDLRESTPHPVAILDKHVGREFAVEGISEAESYDMYASPFPVLEWHREVARIRVSSGDLAGLLDDGTFDEDQRAVASAKLVGEVWLRSQRLRLPSTWSEPREPAPEHRHIRLPAGMARCDATDLCGDARPFGATGWELVITEHACGDGCSVSCVLHDSETEMFAEVITDARAWGPTAEPGPCESVVFAADGEAHAHGKYVCGREGCRDIGGDVVGWLNPRERTSPR